MRMPTYKVTVQKIEEYLGDDIKGYFNPFKSRLKFKFLLETGLILIVYVYIFLLIFWSLFDPSKSAWVLGVGALTVSLFVLIILAYSYFNQKNEHLILCAKKIKDMVNDPQLLWFNSKHEPYSELNPVKGKWGHSSKGKLVDVTFRILAYLKHNETSQSIHNQIKSLNSASSAKKVLNRLVDKTVFDHPIIKKENNDYSYVPWKFQLVDAHGLAVSNPQLESLLDKAWDYMLDTEFRNSNQ